MTGSDSDQADDDLLLNEIRMARQRKIQAEQDLRMLIAYAREFIRPRPYRLADLARAAGMSVSGIRTLYDDSDVKRVADLLRQAASPAACPDA